MRKLCSLLVLLCLFFVGCKKDECEKSIKISLQGFDSTEMADMTLKRYVKGSGFSGTSETNTKNDYKIYPEYDWLAELPNAGRTFRITNITLTDETTRNTIIGMSYGCGWS